LLTNLQTRGAISAVNQIESNDYEYFGLVIILKGWNADSEQRWNWYIYDGWEMVIEQGVTDNSDSALATAKQ